MVNDVDTQQLVFCCSAISVSYVGKLRSSLILVVRILVYASGASSACSPHVELWDIRLIIIVLQWHTRLLVLLVGTDVSATLVRSFVLRCLSVVYDGLTNIKLMIL